MAKQKADNEELEVVVDVPSIVTIKKYGDKTPVQITSAEHYQALIAEHGAENVEAA